MQEKFTGLDLDKRKRESEYEEIIAELEAGRD